MKTFLEILLYQTNFKAFTMTMVNKIIQFFPLFPTLVSLSDFRTFTVLYAAFFLGQSRKPYCNWRPLTTTEGKTVRIKFSEPVLVWSS